jgi:hypothetical protein
MKNSIQGRLNFLSLEPNRHVEFNIYYKEKTERREGIITDVISSNMVNIQFFVLGESHHGEFDIEKDNVIVVKKHLSQMTDSQYEVIGAIFTGDTDNKQYCIEVGKENAEILINNGLPADYSLESLIKALDWLERFNFIYPGWHGYDIDLLVDYNWMTYYK